MRTSPVLWLGLALAAGGGAACRPSGRQGHASGEGRLSPAPVPTVLYAQRDADLHLNRPDGPVIGKLRAGARVALSADGGAAGPNAAMAVRGFGQALALDGAAGEAGAAGLELAVHGFGRPLTVYVSPIALGSRAVALAALATPPGARALFGIPAAFRWTDPQGPEATLEIGRCRPLMVWTDSATAMATGMQDIDGVEITGSLEPGFQWSYGPRSHMSLANCSARAVARVGEDLVLRSSEESGDGSTIRDASQRIHDMPEGYLAVPPPFSPPDPLASAIERGASLYWITDTGSTLACEPWTFGAPRRIEDGGTRALEARLARGRPPAAVRAPEVSWYPAEYRPADASAGPFGHLHLDPIHPNPWRCLCMYDYDLVAATPQVLTVVGYRMPAGVVAVDPGYVERWYLTPGDCETARRQAIEAIERNPAAALTAGFHVQEG